MIHRLATVVCCALLLAGAGLALAGLPSTAAASAAVDDWTHDWEVVRLMHAQPATSVVVYYLGDSTARESVVSDALWTTRLQRRAAAAGKVSSAVVYSLTAHNQTFGMDGQLIGSLPATPAGVARGIVLIGVGLSRFIGPPLRQPAAVTPPSPGEPPVLSPWVRHKYAERSPLSLAHKRALVPRWLQRRWAHFVDDRAANLGAIGRLVDACRKKRLRPVLIDLPLDLAVVRHGLDAPRDSYRAACRRLARRRHVLYVAYADPPRLPNACFWDLMHLLPPCSARWQSLLTDDLVRLLPKEQPTP